MRLCRVWSICKTDVEEWEEEDWELWLVKYCLECEDLLQRIAISLGNDINNIRFLEMSLSQ